MDVIETIEALTSRLSKARRAVQEGLVRWEDESYSAVLVKGSTQVHRISVNGTAIGECDCPDYAFRGKDLSGWCWHRLSAKLLAKEAVYERNHGFRRLDSSVGAVVSSQRSLESGV